ncbi:hypothetical protein ACGFIP_32155 [Micromonospora zamorensis]|uniref:hypothetical protein n=1 Tax=Micromonospora zamorensis TaxID=709883 RepID=UPI00371CD720
MTNVPTGTEGAAIELPAEMVAASSAGQPALTRIGRANMLRAIMRRSYDVDRPALPVPATIRFGNERHAVHLEFDSIPEVEAWAAELGAENVSRDDDVTSGGRRHRYAFALVQWRGFEVCLVALVPAAGGSPEAVSA